MAPKPLPPGMPKAGVEAAAEPNAGGLDAPKPPPNVGVVGVAPKPPKDGVAGCAAPKPPGVAAAPNVGCAAHVWHETHMHAEALKGVVISCTLSAAKHRHHI